ncbi:mitogen-activated protein kinase kinase kinase 5-like isoform X3 [Musa acuminata AAA Group]|uniref:mitogen-activated protein kinase kinase kinase 5-like isoform X3 n=1 Tax=Musa acuminata AAA Group TaxID=214697 RepID=UPI0031DBA364
MPWWNRKSAVSPSSSSSSPSSAASSPGGGAIGRSRARDLYLPWSRRVAVSAAGPVSAGSTPVSRSPSNLDCNPIRSSSSPVLLPQPLPLPELVAAAAAATSPRPESTSAPSLGTALSPTNSVCCPLPSPRDASSRWEGDEANHSATESSSVVEPINDRVASAGVAGSRSPYQNSRRSPELSDISLNGSTFRRNRRMFQGPNSVGAVNFRLNIPAKSAPTSGFSSPVRSPLCSPRRLSNVDFSTFTIATPGLQVWSAPEIPSTEMVSVFSPQTSPEKMVGSPDLSPLYSPSPLHTKLFPENSGTWHENSGNISVHPLPLPPGASSPSQSGFSHQNAAKADAMPMTNQWQKGKLIGSGTFGNVYEATNRQTGALCAMKEVNIIPDDAKSAECIKQLEQEIKFLSQFKHPNIVQYYGSETIDDRLYIYLEYVHPGSINKYVRQHCGAMTESVVRNFTRHILKGLAYLHGKKIMHRDIKGANLLVDVHGVVKLADFGMAKHLNGAAGALSLKGSPYWMAPEAAAMFKVLHRDPPIPDSLSNEGKDFLRCCFRRNPADRPTANMLLEHQFVKHSHHYNVHGSLQAFAGIKIIDNSISPRDKSKSRSESSVKGKHPTNGEYGRSHPETSEAATCRTSLRSAPEIASSSSAYTNYTILSSAGSSVNVLNAVHSAAGILQPYVLPRPHAKEAVDLS